MTAPRDFAGSTVDAAQAALGYLAREWGMHGYAVRIVGDGNRGAICYVSHTDGSEFKIRADQWGGIRHRADTGAHAGINDLIGDLHSVAQIAWADKKGYAGETIEAGATNPPPNNLQHRERLIWDMIDLARRLNEIVD